MGLWERWYDPHGETIETCTILTTEANEVMLPLHGRMPVILDPTSDALWLDPGADATSLRALLVPYHRRDSLTSAGRGCWTGRRTLASGCHKIVARIPRPVKRKRDSVG